MHIWFLISSFFLFSSISILIDESNEIDYHLEYNKKEEINFLDCWRLIDLFKNKSELNLNEISKILIVYFQNEFTCLDTIYDNKKGCEAHKKLILNKIKSKNYLIYSDQFCIILNETEKAIRDLRYYAFSFDNVKYYVLSRNNLLELKDAYQLVYVQIFYRQFVIDDCNKLISNKFSSSNDCIKRKQRLSKYFYYSNESGLIYLNYQMNRSILANEKECYIKFNYHNSCLFAYIIPKYIDAPGKYAVSSAKLFKVYQPINRIDSLIQFVSILCLFFNLTFNQLLSKVTIFLVQKLKSIKKSPKFSIKYFKFLFLIINLILISILNVYLIENYLHKRDNPMRKEVIINIFDLESFDFAICLLIHQLIRQNDTFNYDIYETRRKKFKYSYLEKKIDERFNKSFFDFYLKIQSKKIAINWTIKSKVIFYRNSRCWIIQLDSIKSKLYSNLLSLSKLEIKIKKKFLFKVYLLSRNANLNYESLKIRSRHNIMKRIFRRSRTNRKSKCIDYQNLELNCLSKSDCIRRCVNQFYYLRYGNVYLSALLYKNDFKENEYSKLIYSFNESNQTDYLNIIEECKLKFVEKDCTKIVFENGEIKLNNQIVDENRRKFDLNYEVITTIEQELSIYELLFSMLNIQLIVFGFNSFNLITKLFKFIKLKSKYLIYLCSLVGSIIHLYILFKNLINDDNLIYNQHYDFSKTIRPPNYVICTNKTTINRTDLFNKITYLNIKENRWIKIDTLDIENSIIQIREFNFLYSQKCFKIDLNQKYDSNEFEFRENLNILGIELNRKLINQFNLQIYFTTYKNKTGFSKIANLQLLNDLSHDLAYLIRQEIFIINYQVFDCNLFKYFLSLFVDINKESTNYNKYLYKIINHFERNNDDQSKRPELNLDQLLEDSIKKTKQNKTEFNTINLDERQFTINYLSQKYKSDQEWDLEFGLIFFKRIIIIKHDNYTKLILNLLNLISFWFNLGLFDLHTYLDLFKSKIFDLIICLSIFLNRFLILIKIKFIKLLSIFKKQLFRLINLLITKLKLFYFFIINKLFH